MRTMIEAGQTVLFQGDSITDAGRDRANPAGLGTGYALLAAAQFRALHPQLDVTFLNRGVGGDRVCNLQVRWQADCLDLRPDWVSILIGVNDTWRRFDRDDPTSAEAYEAGLADILSQVRDRLGARMLLLEPFLLPTDEAKATVWREDLDPKIQAARRQARAFGALYVPLDGLFAAACAKAPAAYWAADGVHPTIAGAGLIAQAWLDAVQA